MVDMTYIPCPTPARFHADDDFVRSLIGPIGSGKSVACCVEIMKRSTEQKLIYNDDYHLLTLIFNFNHVYKLL